LEGFEIVCILVSCPVKMLMSNLGLLGLNLALTRMGWGLGPRKENCPYFKPNIFVTASVWYHKATYQLPLCLIDTLTLFWFGTTEGLAIFRMQVTLVSPVSATAGEGIH
jgi:hypothetical protein